MNTSTVIVRTHDPVSGERVPTIEPPSASQGQLMLDAINKQQLLDAVEGVWTGGVNIEVRPLPRSTKAAVRIAADLLREGIITPKMALARVSQQQLEHFQTRSLTNADQLTVLGTGLGAAPGAVHGVVATTAEAAVALAAHDNVILFVTKTTPDDMAALQAVKAIVCTTGGYTSHSAVVARQLGKPCIVSYVGPTLEVEGGVTVDGGSGTVYTGTPVFQEAALDEHMQYLLAQTDEVAKLKVLTNADTVVDYATAWSFGAKGIGLCRTEHTFFTPAGTQAIQRLLFANTPKEKSLALDSVRHVQHSHFDGLLSSIATADEPVTVRLLDPPLHEFLPDPDDKVAVKVAAKNCKLTQGEFVQRIHKLHESNPMLGHRGCRLGITTPAIYETQIKALFDAAVNCKIGGTKAQLDVMIPLINSVREARIFHSMFLARKEKYTCPAVANARFGVMLETPRACLQAYELAEFCDFFSFGTNDLTQATWMLSRDDSASFLPTYVERDIEPDPFMSLDMDGVGKLMAIAIESLGDRRSKVKIGICGEHGGDPRSIAFCHALGLDYVSCSPPRVRTARLAAAHANLSPADGFSCTQIPVQALDNAVGTAPSVPLVIPTQMSLEPIATKEASYALVPPTVTGIQATTESLKAQLATAYKPKTTASMVIPPKSDELTPAALKMLVNIESNITFNPKPVPGWVTKSKSASAEDVALLQNKPGLASAQTVAGFKVGIKHHAGKPSPDWGVLVGIVEMPFFQMYVLAVDHSLGHDGKAMKDLIKFAINVKGTAPLWLVPPSDIVQSSYL